MQEVVPENRQEKMEGPEQTRVCSGCLGAHIIITCPLLHTTSAHVESNKVDHFLSQARGWPLVGMTQNYLLFVCNGEGSDYICFDLVFYLL